MMYFVTPMRNALTLGSIDAGASAGQIYKKVFSQGVPAAYAGMGLRV
jgi:hypothetical protein